MNQVPSPRTRRLLAGLFALGLLGSLRPARSAEEFKDWRPVGQQDWSASANAELGIHHAVILFDGNIVDDSNPGGPTVHSRYLRVRLLDDEGTEAFRQQQIPFRKDWKVTRLAARTLKGNGEILPVTDKDVFDKTLVAFGRRRLKAKAFAFKGVEAGDIVELRYTIRRDDISPPQIQMRHPYYTIESQLIWHYYPQPTGDLTMLSKKQLEDLTYSAAYSIPNGKRFTCERKQFPNDEAPDGVRVTFHNLPALPDGPFQPSELYDAVLFTGYYDFPRRDARRPYWDRIAKLLGEPVRDFLKEQSRLDSWMKQITQNDRDLDQDLAICLDLIHKDIANFSELEESELPEKLPESTTIDELLENRMGEPFDINCLLVAMLQKLGYDATVFLARDSSEGPFDPNWKSMEQFLGNGISGVAVKRNANAIEYCVPYLSSAAPGMVPWEICGANALMYDMAGDEHYSSFPSLCEVPMAGMAGNKMTIDLELRPDDEGGLCGRLRLERGYRNDPFALSSLARTAKRGKKDAHERVRDAALRSDLEWSADGESLSFSVGAIAYSCSIRVEGVVDKAGEMLLLDLGSIRTDDFRFPAGERESLIDYRYPRHYTSTVAVRAPSGFEPRDLVAPVRVFEPYAEYNMTEMADSGTVRLRRDLKIPGSLFRPTAAEKFRYFFEKVYATTEQPVVLSRAAD